MELKDIIESQQKEVQSDPWLTPMFDPTISEEEKRIAINTIIEQTAQIVAREATASLTEAHIEQIREEAKREALKPFKGARNPGEWEDNVWWQGRLKALEEMRAFLKEKIDIHLEIERTRTSYPKDWHEGNRNGLYDALTHLDSLTK